MRQYHDLLKRVLGEGEVQFEPRTREYIIGVSNAPVSTYNLDDGFPLVTTKNVPIRLPGEELLWKLRGERNVKPLVDKDVNIWTANAFDRYLVKNGLTEKFPKHSADWNREFEKYSRRIKTDADFAREAGDLGPVYGYQWRRWRKPVFVPGHSVGSEWNPQEWRVEEIDQLANLIKGIKEKPGSRYHILSAWNPADLGEMALGPCPFLHQFTVYGKNLDLTTVQRSADVFLGVPFNIAQDALLLQLIANETGLMPRKFSHIPINTHAYLGVPPRTDFWENPFNVEKFQNRFRKISERKQYLELREDYLVWARNESGEDKGKDHTPFILEQLSKEPRDLPKVNVTDTPLLELIEMPIGEVITIKGYDPHKWNSKAVMAT